MTDPINLREVESIPPDSVDCVPLTIAERDALVAAVRAARKRIAAKDALLACYRLGRHPSETLMRKLDRTKEWDANITDEEPTDA